MTCNSETIYVRFRSSANENGLGISYFNSAGKVWRPSSIAFGDCTTFTFLSARDENSPVGGGTEFWFRGLNFWAKAEGELISNVVRNFEQCTNGQVNFNLSRAGLEPETPGPVTFIDGVNTTQGSEEVGPGQQSFTVHNRNDGTTAGAIAVHVTVEDRSNEPTRGNLFTSADPEIPVPTSG